MRKVLRAIFIVLGCIVLLVAGVALFITTPPGQRFVRARAENYLRNKLKTGVWIGKLGYGIPKYIVLNDALFLDQAKDTMLAVGTLKVDLDMWKLIKGDIDVQQVILKDAHSHIYRRLPDSNFNFTYALNAFAGKGTTVATTAKDTTATKISLDRVETDNLRLKLEDETGGVFLAASLQHLLLRMQKMDVDNNDYHLKELQIAGVDANLGMDSSYLPPSTDSTPYLKLAADNVDLQRINFVYDDRQNKFLFTSKVGRAIVQLNEYNRKRNNTVDVKKLAIENASGSLVFSHTSSHPSPVDSIVKIDTTEGWFVKAADIDIKNVDFKMDDQNIAHVKGLDYSHLDVQDLELASRDFNYNSLSYPSIMTGHLQHFAVKENLSGLNVKELRTDFDYSNQGVVLRNLFAQTPNTLLRDYAEVRYPFRDEPQPPLQEMRVKLNLTNSYVGLSDVAIFVPMVQQQPMYNKLRNSRITLEAVADGRVDDLNIHKLYLKGLSATEVLVDGKVKGLPDANKLTYNLHVQRLQSSATDVALLAPPAALKDVRLPARFGASGQVAGSASAFAGDLAIMSTDGAAHVKGTMALNPGRERYDMAIETKQFNIGRILKQDPMLGKVTGNFKVNGRGFDVKTMAATFDAHIGAAYVNGYNYNSIAAKGSIAGKKANVDLTSADPNARLSLKGNADFSGKYPVILADAMIDSIDLKALNLYSSDLRARGAIHADIKALNPDYPDGLVVWRHPLVVSNGVRYSTDSLYVLSRPNADSGQNITANVDFLQAHLTGHTPLTALPAIAEERINRYYYALPAIDSAYRNATNVIAARTWQGQRPAGKRPVKLTNSYKELPANYDLNLAATVIDKPLLRALVPGINSFSQMKVTSSLTPSKLVLDASTDRLVYDSVTIMNLAAKANGNDSALTYAVTADQVTTTSFGLYYASVKGAIDNGLITTDISLADKDKVERFALKANMRTVGSEQIIQIEPGLKLNYDTWDVAQPNSIVLATQGLYIQNLQLSHAGQVLRANSEWPRPNSPLKVNVTGFQLANITQVLSKSDTLLATGTLNADLTLAQTRPPLKMTGTAQVQDLAVYGDTLGNLQANILNLTENELQTKVTLTGHGNDLTAEGYYYPTPVNGNNINMTLHVNALSVRSIEGMAMHQIRNSSGYVRGDLRLTGTLAKPDIAGKLRTDNVVTTVSSLGSEFKLPSEEIDFADNKASFNNFSLVDHDGNKADVTGNVDLTNLADPHFDMHISAANWHALHSTAKDNGLFYGDVYVTANLNIHGSGIDPAIEGNITVQKKTKLTIVSPSTTPVESSAGIVEFVNSKDSLNTGRLVAVIPRDSASRLLRLKPGAGINVGITVDKDAEFTVIVDQSTGDYVTAKGEGSIEVAVRPGGSVDITGVLTIHSGYYQMNYNFIRRRFTVQDGGTITFGGDMLKNTTLDVVAVYDASIPPYDLVARQIPDPSELNYFRQKLPFKLNVLASGNMMSPRLTFDIVLPENKIYALTPDNVDLVQSRLAQVRADTNQMNKQAFSVLVLNHFLSDDGISSSVTTSASTVALQSVSAFVENELNSVAGNLVKGVDLSVDVASTDDYTTGALRRRTDLNISASKRLLNDRLKLTVGNNFELEGPQTSRSGNGGIPANLAADYLLTGDGRYTARVYHTNYDAGVLQGFIQENGAALIVSRDYNRLRQVFMRKPRAARHQRNTANTTNSAGR